MSVTTNRRYRTDPEFRARVLRDVRQRTERLIRSDPRYKVLFNLRRKVFRLRDSIDYHMRKAGLAERRLMEAISKRDKLAQELRKR